MERWVQTCRRELLARCLLWNERHLRHALGEYENFYNQHRAHHALGQAAPLRAIPIPDHRASTHPRPEHPPTRPARRNSPRVLTCRLTRTDVIFGRRTVDLASPADATKNPQVRHRILFLRPTGSNECHRAA
ncbi:hypothetical protein [Nonomuraea endophytica]|uniref:hypothetical protein n=1 Tax=Nonomuraea endophytica TaxID=714136 RepID=UPI0037CB2B92